MVTEAWYDIRFRIANQTYFLTVPQRVLNNVNVLYMTDVSARWGLQVGFITKDGVKAIMNRYKHRNHLIA